MKTTHEQLRLVTAKDLPEHQLTSYRQRKAVGDKTERLVREELVKHNYEVNAWGQGILGPMARAALKSNPNGMRWAPDFFVARGGRTAFIDAKGSMSSDFRDSYFIESNAVDAHLRLFTDLSVPIFYVFNDLMVIDVLDAIRYGRVRAGTLRGSGTPLRSVPMSVARSFDSVFGVPGQSVPLRAVA